MNFINSKVIIHNIFIYYIGGTLMIHRGGIILINILFSRISIIPGIRAFQTESRLDGKSLDRLKVDGRIDISQICNRLISRLISHTDRIFNFMRRPGIPGTQILIITVFIVRIKDRCGRIGGTDHGRSSVTSSVRLVHLIYQRISHVQRSTDHLAHFQIQA